MTKTILTYNDLLEEKSRLENLLKAQKELIQLDVQEIKNELKPATNILNFVGNVGESARKNPLLGFAMGMGTDLLLRKFLFNKVGFVAKLVLPFLVRNASSKIVSKTKGGFLKKLLGKISKN